MNRKFIVQFFKYGMVGVLNTLVCAIVIWLVMNFVFQIRGEREASPIAISISNITGYVSGLINSFVFNRKWTFRSRGNWKIEFMKFIGAFLICYIPQLLLVMGLNRYATIPSLQFHAGVHEYTITSAYICQLIGMVFYTLLNFLLNKYYTFKT